MLDTIIYFGINGALIMALMHIFEWNLSRSNLAGGIMNIAAAIFLYGLLNLGHAVQDHDYSLLILLPSAIFVGGPTNLLYYSAVSAPQLPFRTLLHYTLPLIVFVGETLLLGVWPGTYNELVANALAKPLWSVGGLLIFVGSVHFFGYLIYLRRFIPSTNPAPEIRFLVYNIYFAFTWMFIAGAAFVFKEPKLYGIAGMLMSVLVIAILLIRYKYKDRFYKAVLILREGRYQRSRLAGMDTDLLATRLKQLMQDEELFLEPELTLKDVASRLNLSENQLSQLINAQMGTDFRSYINGLRVAKAQFYLNEEPDLTVLRICFLAGFQSKSAFNSAFKKTTGLTPTAYRQKV